MKSLFIFFSLLIIGILIAFYPTILSSFRYVQADLGDTRFSHYLLEHSYLWITSAPQHRYLWDLPIFYPFKNTLAYSDMMLGPAPIYWFIRLFFHYDTAYQLWLVVIFSLNYIFMYLFLKKCLKYSVYPSSIGSFIFSFSIPRTEHISHAQLLPEFFIIVSLFGLYKLFTESDKSTFWFFCFFTGIVLQLITGYYLAFFWFLSLVITLLISLIFYNNFRIIINNLKKNLFTFSMLLITSTILIIAVYQHYYRLSRNTGYFSLDEVYSYMPNIYSWFYSGNSLFYSRLNNSLYFFNFVNSHEKVLSVGYFTSSIIIYTIFRHRKNHFINLILLTVFVLIVITTIIPFFKFSIWTIIAEKIFLFRSVKAIGRIIIILLIPISIFVAEFFQKFKSKNIIVLISLLIILEQIQVLPFYNKFSNRVTISNIALRIPKNCNFFYYVSNKQEADYKTHLNAMWAGLLAQKYTINGYSGWYPPNYNDIFKSNAVSEHELLLIKEKFDEWIAKYSISKQSSCIVY